MQPKRLHCATQHPLIYSSTATCNSSLTFWLELRFARAIARLKFSFLGKNGTTGSGGLGCRLVRFEPPFCGVANKTTVRRWCEKDVCRYMHFILMNPAPEKETSGQHMGRSQYGRQFDRWYEAGPYSDLEGGRIWEFTCERLALSMQFLVILCFIYFLRTSFISC